ncbi:MAG: PEGA domain-containing protein [Polyangiales bacterium]
MRAACLIVSISLALPSFALAAPKEAAEHEKKGQIAFIKKDWATAKTEYAAAWETSKSPQDAYFAGRATEELGHAQEAASWYQKALGAGKLAEEKDARARLAALEKKPVAVTIETEPEGATIRIDGTASSQKSPFFVRLSPGTHKIVAEFGGKTAAKEIEVAPFTPVTVKIEVSAPSGTPAPTTEPPKPAEPVAPAEPVPPAPAPQPTPEPAPVTTTSHASSTRQAAYVTGGIALVALGFGTVYGIKALDDRSKYNDFPTQGRADLIKRDRLVADIGFALGIGLAVTSVVLYVNSSKHEVAIAPIASPTLAGFGFATRF